MSDTGRQSMTDKAGAALKVRRYCLSNVTDKEAVIDDNLIVVSSLIPRRALPSTSETSSRETQTPLHLRCNPRSVLRSTPDAMSRRRNSSLTGFIRARNLLLRRWATRSVETRMRTMYVLLLICSLWKTVAKYGVLFAGIAP